MNFDGPTSWTHDFSNQFKDGGFAGAIGADDTNTVARVNVKGDVIKYSKTVDGFFAKKQSGQELFKGFLIVAREIFADVVETDDRFGLHIRYCRRRFFRGI